MEDLGIGHSGCQVFEHIIDRDSQPANAWFAVALARFDAYPFFSALGDAIEIGPTGNNLRDLRILLAY